MKKAIYMIPTTMTAKGLPLEYRIVNHSTDKRTRFYKNHSKYIIDDIIPIIRTISQNEIKVKDNRIIVKNCEQARMFRNLISEFYAK